MVVVREETVLREIKVKTMLGIKKTTTRDSEGGRVENPPL
jgi:hypothetical protein